MVLWWQRTRENDSDMRQIIHIHERCCWCCWCPLYRDSPNPQEQEASVRGLYPEINQPILCSNSSVRARVQRDDSYLKNIMFAQSHLFARSAGHRLISSIHHLLPGAGRKSNYKNRTSQQPCFRCYYTAVPVNSGFPSLTLVHRFKSQVYSV